RRLKGIDRTGVYLARSGDDDLRALATAVRDSPSGQWSATIKDYVSRHQQVPQHQQPRAAREPYTEPRLSPTPEPASDPRVNPVTFAAGPNQEIPLGKAIMNARDEHAVRRAWHEVVARNGVRAEDVTGIAAMWEPS